MELEQISDDELKTYYESVIPHFYRQLRLLEIEENEEEAAKIRKLIRTYHLVYQKDLRKDKFGLIEEEFLLCLHSLNGVLPTINVEEQFETITVNILAGESLEDVRLLPEKLEKLSFWQRLELYCIIRQFWDKMADSQ